MTPTKNKLSKTSALFLQTLERLEYGSLKLRLPEGQSYFFQGKYAGPQAQLKIHDLSVIPHLILRGDIGFAEDYRIGKWDSPDLCTLLEYALRNKTGLKPYVKGYSAQQWLTKLSYLLNLNTKKGSRKNIHAHYDLGNSFYKLWLDPSMTYSSALFQGDAESLTQAQYNKYDRILGRLGGTPKDILEIGCGWGGFLERSLQTSDHRLTGITISPAQYSYAKQRLKTNKPTDKNKGSVFLQDYRDTEGKFDAIVSIEMFEAIGERYWKTYFSKIKSLLKEQGKALIQTITIADEHFAPYRKSGDAIRSYIFPGGMLPCPSRFEEEAQKAGLQITDQFFFGQDYCRTLNCWLKRFEEQSDVIKTKNFDDSFIRLWRFYLAACSATFSSQRTNVMQVELCHA